MLHVCYAANTFSYYEIDEIYEDTSMTEKESKSWFYVLKNVKHA